MKEDMLINYFEGNLVFLLNCFNNKEYGKHLLNKDYVFSAMMGNISNIFLNIKEELVDKDGGSHSRIDLDDFEKSILCVADKVSNGYKIDNYVFDNPAICAETIRNKIAHGDFTIDFNNRKVILNVAGNSISIDSKRLFNYVVTSLKLRSKLVNDSGYKKTIFYNNGEIFRHKPLSRKEIETFLRNYKVINFSLSRKDGKLLEKEKAKKLDDVINNFNISHDYSYLDRYKTEFGDDYIFNYEVSSLPVNKLSYIKRNVKEQNFTNYNDQIEFINRIVSSFFDSSPYITAMITNLCMLDIIDKNNVTDFNRVKDIFTNTYGNEFYFDYNNIGLIAVNSFISLFPYGMENILASNNLFTNEYINGFDYSKLDTSSFKIRYMEEEHNLVKDAREKKNGSYNNLETITSRINKLNMSLNSVRANGNVNAVERIKNNLSLLDNNKIEALNKYNENNAIYESMNNYYNSNLKYFKNLAIIEGIRNSIAHGNYEIVNKKNNVYINFKDIYNGNITFECDIDLMDFRNFIIESGKFVEEYLNNKKNTMSL